MDLQDAGSTARYLIRDRDGKYPMLFDAILADSGITVVRSGVQMPRMNAIMERWVRTCRAELLDRTLIWNQRHLIRALREYEDADTRMGLRSAAVGTVAGAAAVSAILVSIGTRPDVYAAITPPRRRPRCSPRLRIRLTVRPVRGRGSARRWRSPTPRTAPIGWSAIDRLSPQ